MRRLSFPTLALLALAAAWWTWGRKQQNTQTSTIAASKPDAPIPTLRPSAGAGTSSAPAKVPPGADDVPAPAEEPLQYAPEREAAGFWNACTARDAQDAWHRLTHEDQKDRLTPGLMRPDSISSSHTDGNTVHVTQQRRQNGKVQVVQWQEDKETGARGPERVVETRDGFHLERDDGEHTGPDLLDEVMSVGDGEDFVRYHNKVIVELNVRIPQQRKRLVCKLGGECSCKKY